ncbi:endonuclease III [Candidatus Woesearchaeota archaeon]|nr:endonuclease III [Candidatus Woesearchaeota archaeon]
MDKRASFLRIFAKAEKKYGLSTKRLAAEGWLHDWQVLIVTIMSAQSRDEITIPLAEKLFEKYGTLEKLAGASYDDVFAILKSLNYNRTKSKNVIAAARHLIEHYNGKVPLTMDELLTIPGVGRKTANLVLAECHGKDAICVDTHCHRILNVLGIVKTKTPHETEAAMMDIAPRPYWSRINRILVLWGKDCPGREKKKLLKKLEEP